MSTPSSIDTSRVESEVFRSARNYFADQGFVELFPPRIVRASGACENVDTLFEVRVDGDHKWFEPNGTKSHSYLAQTGQLYLEAYVPKYENVYCVGPSFRAEDGVDARHLTEFTMLEIEFAGGFEKLLQHIEGMVSHVAHAIGTRSSKFGIDEDHAMRLKSCPSIFPRITYDEAIEKLASMGETIEWGDDIDRHREQKLVLQYGNVPLFITHYPDPMINFGKEIEVEKFFNMLPDPKRPGRVQSSDLILPISGESVGSAARVHEVQMLVDRLSNSKMFKRLEKRGGSMEDFSWYIDHVRDNGAVPHAGCGFGMARILQWIIGVADIRDAVTFVQNKEQLI
ncbi:MAG: hypothetical protein NTX72_04970 [Candidatus Uhrbacteria bacterium]|nr:hypothetical protein [Candidatus Uhrbacteria bacterium]